MSISHAYHNAKHLFVLAVSQLKFKRKLGIVAENEDGVAGVGYLQWCSYMCICKIVHIYVCEKCVMFNNVCQWIPTKIKKIPTKICAGVLCPLLWKIYNQQSILHELVIFSHNQTFMRWGHVVCEIYHVYRVKSVTKVKDAFHYLTSDCNSKENVKLNAFSITVGKRKKRWTLTLSNIHSSKDTSRHGWLFSFALFILLLKFFVTAWEM